jgi:hypothetical protein
MLNDGVAILNKARCAFKLANNITLNILSFSFFYTINLRQAVKTA